MYSFKVYKIISSLCDEIYIGTTVLPFEIEMSLLFRQALERKERGKNLNGLHTLMMEQGIDHLKMELIEEVSSDKISEKQAKREAIEAYDPRLNVVRASSKKCEHGLAVAFCRQCSGSVFCQHNRQKHACVECIPVHCRVCDRTYAPDSFRAHIKTLKHAKRLLTRGIPP